MRSISPLAGAVCAVLACVPAAASAQAPHAAAPATSTQATTQLPRSVRPSHYQVAVTPDMARLTFAGQVGIDIEVLQPVDSITLNALDLAFGKVALLDKAGKSVAKAPKVSVDEKAQTVTLQFAQQVPVGQYRLQLAYTGKINTQANGLFSIDYENKAGKQRALFTQFEAADARRFIPSWDEPAYKATFSLQATVPEKLMAVGNMPVADEKAAGKGLKTIRFQDSPKMSTYLLFFGLGDLERATRREGDVEIGVVAQKGAVAQAQYALDESARVLREYNDYFGTPYPLPKLDNIASPGQSGFFSAMENWGAIFTFEYALLLDPSISTVSDRQTVFGVAAHEMAHQWFGDLVTMRWWDDLWLNEGFASWMAERTTQKLHPEWNTRLDSVSSSNGAMNRDAMATTHPIVQHLKGVDEIAQAFDAITYSKGEAVINMLEHYVGADNWRTGVRAYIKAHAYGNTESADLWKAVQDAAGKPVMQIAQDFTTQPGVPLVKVTSATCSRNTTTLALEQGEFTRDRPDKTPLRWNVPVIASVLGSKPVTTLLQDGKGSVTLSGCGPVIVNAGQSGYFRTRYPQAMVGQLRDAFSKIDSIDQLGILNDAQALGFAGDAPLTDYLELASKVPEGAAPQVWEQVARAMQGLDSYYKDDSPQRSAFRTFAIGILHPEFARIGWDGKAGEPDPVKNLRATLIGALSRLGDADVVTEARKRYQASLQDPQALSPELRKIVSGVVADNADAATWDQLHATAKAEKTPLVRDMYYQLLASPKDPALARRALELALTAEPGETMTPQMIAIVSGDHSEMAFDFALAHRDALGKKIDASNATRYYPQLAMGSLDPAMVDKVSRYADTYIPANARMAANSAIENIKYRINVLDKRMPQVNAWVKEHVGR